MQYFNIQVASQLSGVASATIRAWEKRYNAVVPERGDNGHRLYSEKDIEKLALLFRLTEVGQSIGKIAHLELPELKEVFTALLHEPYQERHLSSPQVAEADYHRILTSLSLALASYKVDIIAHELEKATALFSPRDLALRIVIPLFQEIGQKVVHGELNVAQEHTLSALTTFYLGRTVGNHYQRTLQRQEIFLIGTPEGEQHEIGALAAALLCVGHGFRFIYMGANLPAISFAEAANALKATAILLGCTRDEFHSGVTIETYVDELEVNLSGKTAIWTGGRISTPMVQKLKKRRMTHFPTLLELDQFLEKY